MNITISAVINRVVHMFYTLVNSPSVLLIGGMMMVFGIISGFGPNITGTSPKMCGLSVCVLEVSGEILYHPKIVGQKINGILLDQKNNRQVKFLTYSNEKIGVGDFVSLGCKFDENGNDFLFCSDLKLLKSSENLLKKFPRFFREKIISTINKNFTESTASLINGILIGDSYSIPTYLKEEYKISGIMHIVAVSGFNMGVVAGLFNLILKSLQIRIRIFLNLLIMLLYLSVVGFDNIPALRAYLTIFIISIGRIFGRRPNTVYVVILASLIICIIYADAPSSISFQLSTLAGLAMSLGNKKLEILVINIFLLPVLTYNFGIINTLGLISNIIILPFIAPLTYLSFVFLLLPEFINRIIIIFIEFITRLIQGMAGFIAQFSNLNINVGEKNLVVLSITLMILFILIEEFNYRKFKT